MITSYVVLALRMSLHQVQREVTVVCISCLCVPTLGSQACLNKANIHVSAEGDHKERKIYVVRCHNGSLCLKRQPGVIAGLYAKQQVEMLCCNCLRQISCPMVEDIRMTMQVTQRDLAKFFLIVLSIANTAAYSGQGARPGDNILKSFSIF